MPLSLSQSQQQRLAQTQTMSPVQRQSLEILHLPIMELEQKIRAEAETNPAILEVVAPKFELATPVHDAEARFKDGDRQQYDDEVQVHEPSARAEAAADSGGDRDFSEPSYSPGGEDSAAEERRRYMFESIRQPVSLEDHLRGQINLAGFDKAEAEIAEMIVANLSSTGMLSVSTGEIAEVTDVSLSCVEKVLSVIQETFDPPGIAARTAVERLTLQLKASGAPGAPLAIRVVAECIEDLKDGGRESRIAEKLGITADEAAAAVKLVKSMNPNPVAEFDAVSPTDYIVPELDVVRGKDGRWGIKYDDSTVTHLKIDDSIRHILNDAKASAEDKAYARDKIRTAEALATSLDLRVRTISQIGEAIVAAQQDFFTYGVSRLKPMTLSDIAEQVDCHETTVGRAVSGKYLRSPRGIFELKYFFSTGVRSSGEGSAEISNKAVMNRIAEIIHAENPAKPYSDQAILDILARNGIDIKRRTVTKYRENLGIPSSSNRRRR